MEIRVLKYFLAVAETGSVTAAARRVRVAQPSLSRQLRAMELELGVDLFRRKPGSLTLNAAGTRFVTVARDLVGRAERAVEVMAAAGRDEEIGLTVVAPQATVSSLLAPYLARGGTGPALVDAVQAEPGAVFDTLLGSQADLGVSTSPPPAPLESAFLGHAPVVAQFAEGHHWNARTRVTLAELAEERLILMNRGNAARLVLDAALAREGRAARAVRETGSSAFAQARAAAGHGVCLVIDGARFGLREATVETDEGPLRVPLYAGWDRTHYARDALLELVEGIREYSAHR